jgi:hypothetical protein
MDWKNMNRNDRSGQSERERERVSERERKRGREGAKEQLSPKRCFTGKRSRRPMTN